jgi:hypothetical protein
MNQASMGFGGGGGRGEWHEASIAGAASREWRISRRD